MTYPVGSCPHCFLRAVSCHLHHCSPLARPHLLCLRQNCTVAFICGFDMAGYSFLCFYFALVLLSFLDLEIDVSHRIWNKRNPKPLRKPWQVLQAPIQICGFASTHPGSVSCAPLPDHCAWLHASLLTQALWFLLEAAFLPNPLSTYQYPTLSVKPSPNVTSSARLATPAPAMCQLHLSSLSALPSLFITTHGTHPWDYNFCISSPIWPSLMTRILSYSLCNPCT